MGVKEELNFGRVGCGPKRKILKHWNINAQWGRIPWAIFTKFSTIVDSFMDAAKIWADSLKWFRI